MNRLDPDRGERGRATFLADLVHERLHRALVAGDYARDERLPSENALAERFEVSRPVVRDALRRLRDEGLVYSRQGSGSYARGGAPKTTLAFAPLETIADLQRCYEFRVTLEPEAAALAADRRGAADLAAIEAALTLMRDAALRRHHREDADFSFHLAITAAANNQYFQTAMQALEDHIAIGMKFHGLSLRTQRDGLDHVLDEHATILEAIRAGDPDAARRGMFDHVAKSRDRLFEGRQLDLSTQPEA